MDKILHVHQSGKLPTQVPLRQLFPISANDTLHGQSKVEETLVAFTGESFHNPHRNVIKVAIYVSLI